MIVYRIFNNKLRASETCALRRSREERVEEISGLRKLLARRLFLRVQGSFFLNFTQLYNNYIIIKQKCHY